MTRKLHQLIKRTAATDYDNWMTGVPALVAETEDPEHEHRIRVVIPVMDEEKIYPEWVRWLGGLVLGPGFGAFFLPPKGAEVMLFGQLGQKHHLFYLGGLYNEDFKVPADFTNAAVAGFRVPGDLKLIAEGDLQLRGGGMQIEVDGALNIIAPAGFFVNGKPV
jgi:hypothetical protein